MLVLHILLQSSPEPVNQCTFIKGNKRPMSLHPQEQQEQDCLHRSLSVLQQFRCQSLPLSLVPNIPGGNERSL